MRKIQIFDSTLRDGAQGEGISYSLSDKLAIVRALDEFGIDYIEAGNPGSNPKDLMFFERLRTENLRHARVTAFGSTHRKGIAVADDVNVRSLLSADTPAVTIFGKAWDLHAEKILRITKEENLEIVYNTVKFFKDRGKEVIFDAEHYFDGAIANEAYALQVLRTAYDAGADSLCLCDTNGGTLPEAIRDMTATAVRLFPDRTIGIHCHNDTGCAVASSISAVLVGAAQVQGTFIGNGERCGNADLSIIIPNLQLKLGYNCIDNDMSALYGAVREICEISNMRVYRQRPYVGDSAFAHKGGMHIDGVSKFPASFEHIEPESVGNSRRFLMSEVSGRSTVIKKLETVAPELRRDSPEVAEILEKLKMLENEGYQYEGADASFELMALRLLGRFHPHFKPLMYRTSGEYPPPIRERSASAILSIEVDGREETTASMGNGPVNALDNALRKALSVFYPGLSNVRLSDYKVRVLTGAEATASKVRVLIESTDGEKSWTTVGVSTDVVAASWEALCDSLEYILLKKEGKEE